MSRDLVLFSGGVDSAVCLLGATNPVALGVDYGQLHHIELVYARTLANRLGVQFIRQEAHPAILRAADGMTYPGRNAMLLGLALKWAVDRGCDRILIGCNLEDGLRFPDCRPTFLGAIDVAYQAAYGVAVVAPLLNTPKAQVMARARELSIPLDQTWSCYSVGPQPCGQCLACRMRAAQPTNASARS